MVAVKGSLLESLRAGLIQKSIDKTIPIAESNRPITVAVKFFFSQWMIFLEN